MTTSHRTPTGKNKRTYPESIKILVSDDGSVDIDKKPLEKQKDIYEKRYEQDTGWRSKLSWWVIAVDSVWLISIIIILILLGVGCLNLPTPVIITLLATTTINVLGLAFIVLRGMFPNK